MVRALDLALLCFLDIIWRVLVRVCFTDGARCQKAYPCWSIPFHLGVFDVEHLRSMKERECSYLAKYMLVIASKFADLKTEERNTYA